MNKKFVYKNKKTGSYYNSKYIDVKDIRFAFIFNASVKNNIYFYDLMVKIDQYIVVELNSEIRKEKLKKLK